MATSELMNVTNCYYIFARHIIQVCHIRVIAQNIHHILVALLFRLVLGYNVFPAEVLGLYTVATFNLEQLTVILIYTPRYLVSINIF